ncbi:M2 family metallopeptidase [Sphingomonas sp. CGMCC 1.13654]|uniref:M2 family metallopeptidase n=1 Tax=Sphingomonas chungangi TaxID=2683589 RepID=A0A838L506_9SPHN|nr:M2 family metallopeptidase [Sphingomonas chungangi]MBA2933539.1 M2 family metallopeptidase [Sphingomonas chungangi]MVW54872.1 peptidase M2 family protein [Sphingomonas chungangi]
MGIPKTAVLLAAISIGRPAIAAARSDPPSSPAVVDAFVQKVEADSVPLTQAANQANWVSWTDITDDTAAIAARANATLTTAQVGWAEKAAGYAKIPGLSFNTRRKLDLLREDIALPAPSTPGAADTLGDLTAKLTAIYGRGQGTLGGRPISGTDIEAAMGTERDPAKLAEMWTSWHDQVGTPMKPDYGRIVEISNQGARELGYADTGAMWRASYDMPPAEFTALLDKVWNEVRPLYVQLHCYVGRRLSEKYGPEVQKPEGPIRADLLGDMWAQDWENIFDIVAPPAPGGATYDLTSLLDVHGYDPLKMVRTGEHFYRSLGFEPLPDSFWQRSQFTKPLDREVVCHASAWWIDNPDDIRMKTCLKVNAVDFATVHHELGHDFYYRSFDKQPFLYQAPANGGVDEAIGDFVSLSITPDYLTKIGLLRADQMPGADQDIALLLRSALEKVTLLPFSLVMDKWRWGVFDGSITPDRYESAWNDLRRTYQGVVPPSARSQDAFDPGAKYHVAEVTPYSAYFLARVLQFQFFQSACAMAGWKGPLHRCSFYGNRVVGDHLRRMLEMGRSRPWLEAVRAMTGKAEVSSDAMLDYYRPLMAWLQRQNAGEVCSW